MTQMKSILRCGHVIMKYDSNESLPSTQVITKNTQYTHHQYMGDPPLSHGTDKRALPSLHICDSGARTYLAEWLLLHFGR